MELIKDMFQKSKFINRNVRKIFSQSAQRRNNRNNTLCDLCVNSLRSLRFKKSLAIGKSEIINQK